MEKLSQLNESLQEELLPVLRFVARGEVHVLALGDGLLKLSHRRLRSRLGLRKKETEIRIGSPEPNVNHR